MYLGGSYQYDEDGTNGPYVANHRAVLRSTDAGMNFTDMTMDSTDVDHPNGMHPDQHRLVTNPRNPSQFFEASDGGIIRSSGQFADRSSDCDSRGLAEPYLSRCHELLSAIPTRLESMNRGLGTIQFQSLSVSPFDSGELQGGTQDNGTWENYGSTHTWLQTFWGDGGQSGFDAADPHFRFHTFFDASPDVNFSDGAITDWNWIADPIYGDREPVLRRDHLRPGRPSDDVRRGRDRDVRRQHRRPDEDARHGHDDAGRAQAALQRAHRRLRGSVR